MNRKSEIIRYVINGVFATIIHFSVLTINLKLLNFNSAGIANFVAAIFGITSSFLGSRYFVFKNFEESIARQAVKFSLLYGLIALIHGSVLWVITDNYGISYVFGFALATVIQLSLSYFGNKHLVFKV